MHCRYLHCRWVWNNNFAEYYMGNYIPPVDNSSQIYLSDANVPISVDFLKERYSGYASRGVTDLPYFSIMEYGGTKYPMHCLPTPAPAPATAPAPARAPQPAMQDPSNPACQGPINIQNCTAPDPGSEMAWVVVSAAEGVVQLQLAPTLAIGADGSDDGNTVAASHLLPSQLCLTAVHGSQLHETNDELNVHPCNTSNSAQRWLWNASASTGSVLQTAMTAAEIATLWGGRPGRCNTPPCCVDVNSHVSTNGQVLSGAACTASTPWHVHISSSTTMPSEAAVTSFMIEAVNEQGFCLAVSPNFPPPPPPSPPPPPPPTPDVKKHPWVDANAYFVNQSQSTINDSIRFLLFRNDAQNRDLRCALHPSTLRLRSVHQKSVIFMCVCFFPGLQHANLRSASGDCVYR